MTDLERLKEIERDGLPYMTGDDLHTLCSLARDGLKWHEAAASKEEVEAGADAIIKTSFTGSGSLILEWAAAAIQAAAAHRKALALDCASSEHANTALSAAWHKAREPKPSNNVFSLCFSADPETGCLASFDVAIKGNGIDALVRNLSELDSHIKKFVAPQSRIADLDLECQMSMRTIADERERVEKAADRIAFLESHCDELQAANTALPERARTAETLLKTERTFGNEMDW